MVKKNDRKTMQGKVWRVGNREKTNENREEGKYKNENEIKISWSLRLSHGHPSSIIDGISVVWLLVSSHSEVFTNNCIKN